jgi:predicted dienelactone hydrolase
MNYIGKCKRGITLLSLLVVYFQGMNNMAFADEPSQKPQPATIKVDNIDLYHATKKRLKKLDLWYKENTCMDKERKQKQTAKLNIAILSHGAMGAAKDYSWLAYPLAAKG